MRSVGFASLLCVLAILCTAGVRPAKAGTCPRPIGAIVSIQGQVDVQSAVDGRWRPAWLDQPLCPGDVIRTGERSRAEAALVDQPKFRIDQNTSLRLVHVPDAQPSLVDLIKGAVYFFSRYPRVLEVSTPFVNALVEGTEFLLRVDETQTLLTVFEGVIAATNDQGRLQVTAGRSAVARAGDAPQPFTLVRPRDAVQWALYYPPVLPALADRSAEPPATLVAPLRQAVRLAASGEYSGAFAAFEAVPAPARNADYYVYRAGTLLQVGRAEQAQSDLGQALREDPGNGEAYALRAVIAVTKNDKTQALNDAHRAVELSPSSAAAKIALSYAQQAQFELKAARQTLQRAVEDEPGNALAWARLAELWLMEGRRSRAVKTAGTARDLAPKLERVQTVLGFAQLARIETRAAKESFLNAIELNSADPLPRFGLGLARIREGDLKWGRGEIEIAVALDPDNALLRAYLGKAYYEERTADPKAYFEQLIAKLTGDDKPSLAGQQFEIAKNLDPNDPTPWFYDAIRKQSENRPVEALHDLQKSIALNDNRAVYRSRQLLDEDRAGRGASLARIYNDLGFEQLGISEATKSLSIDPSNAAAHRFLSDVYATQPRREIARVSELLQAQLLQDVNINPVQPSLSETGLNIFTGGGPTSIGFNEFTPLFERNQAQLNISGQVGSNQLYADEAVVSGVYDYVSVSAGQFHYHDNGFRENFGVKHNIYNLFAQAAVTPEFNIQGELITRESDSGDRSFNYDRDVFDENFKEEIDNSAARFGLRFSPSDRSDFLASFVYVDRDETDSFQVNPTDYRANIFKQDGWSAEGQQLFRGNHFNLAAGFGFNQINTERHFRRRQTLAPPQQVLRFTFTEQKEGYVYLNTILPQSMKWTFGVGYVHFDQGNIDVEKPYPKFGVQWDVTNRIRLRAAAFRSIKPQLIANRTLQPTEVAGFTQFFDDSNGTDFWRYGVGIDTILHPDLLGGFELSRRKINAPVFLAAQDQFVIEDRNEKQARAYLYWTIDRMWSATGELQLDLYNSQTGSLNSLPSQVETWRVPLSLHYFNSSGFFSQLTGTFVRQDVSRNARNLNTGARSMGPEGSDNFFVVDAVVGYRLPQRRGLLSIGVNNLFDTGLKYQDDSFRTFSNQPPDGPFFPERTVLARLTLNL